MAVLARAALMGARGNSGVILSQMLRAYVHHLAGAAVADKPAETIAAAMAVGDRSQLRRRRHARRGHDPQRVPRGLRRSCGGRRSRARTRDVFTAAAAAARAALARTPEQRTCWPVPGSSTPAAEGCASCSTRSRRPPPGAGHRPCAPDRHPSDPGRGGAAR